MFWTLLRFLQRILYAILVRVWLFTGNLIRWIRPNLELKIQDIATLVFNRSDRLGDAVITLPFILETVAHLRSLGWRGEVIVIASPLNEPILAPVRTIEWISLIVRDTSQGYDYERSIWSVFTSFIHFCKTHASRVTDTTREKVLFVDFVDSISEISLCLYTEFPKAYWISANRGIFNAFFDFTLPERFSGSTQIQLIDSCTQLLEWALGLDWLREHLVNQVDVFYPPHSTPKRRAILLFVGVKQHRNFDIAVWEKLIKTMAHEFPDWDIDILDESSKNTLKQLPLQDWLGNVHFLENTMSLAELPEFASGYRLVVGIDGGGINIMRSHTNSLTLFTFGNGVVWGPSLLGRTPTSTILSHNWELHLTQMRDNRFAGSIYKKSIWLPAFQIPLSKWLVSDFPVSEVVQALKSRL